MTSTRRFGIIFMFLLLTLLIQSSLIAQTVTDPWSISETEHFRISYPDDYLEWSQHMIVRLESIHEKVTALVGFTPETKTDVVVVDPLKQANGMGIPFMNRPRIILFTTPPDSSSTIGFYSDWTELLMIHEYTHIVHLTQPSRNPWLRSLGKLLPLGPVTLNSPDWIVEGYATLLEGELTGLGRPNGSLRAMFVRQLAATGQLPTYEGLNGSERWVGGAYPYLFGSAFCEWLQERDGDQALVHLWKRMTAVTTRSFDEAFSGVFQAPADELYGLFAAEMTARAVELKEKMSKEGMIEGELWQRREWATGRPSLSPDGTLMALNIRERSAAPRLEIWSTTEVEEEKAEDLEEDPEDVPAKVWQPPRRKKLHTLLTTQFSPPSDPVFMPDGKSILYTRFMTDSNGDYHPDLFLWNFEDGSTRRLTRHADILDASPCDGGKHALGVRTRFGKSELVQVDLQTGGITTLMPAALSPLYFLPVVSPDDTRLAVIVHRNGHWRLEVYDRQGLSLQSAIGDGREIMTTPAWNKTGDGLYYVSDRRGIPNIEFHDLRTGETRSITNVFGGTLAPALDPTGSSLYYLSFWAKGLNIFRFDLTAAQEMAISETRDVSPLLLPPENLPEVEGLTIRESVDAKSYGLGRQEFSSVTGFSIVPQNHTLQLGLRIGDIIGRHETLIMGGYRFSEGFEGAMLRTTFRFMPVEMSLHAYTIDEDFDAVTASSSPLSESFDGVQNGISASLGWNYLENAFSLDITTGFLLSRISTLSPDETINRQLFDISPQITLFQNIDRWRFYQAVSGRYQGGQTDDRDWSVALLTLEGGIGFDESGINLTYQTGSSGGDPTPFDYLSYGGIHSSLMPGLAMGNRIMQPALEPFSLSGQSVEHGRVEVNMGSNTPLRLYGESTRFWNEDREMRDPFRVIGAEITVTLPRFAVINLAGHDLSVGVMKALDDPIKDDVRGYFFLTLNPNP